MRCYAAMFTRKVMLPQSLCVIFSYPSLVSIFTHYAPPFEIFLLSLSFSFSIVQHVFYRSLVGKWMRLLSVLTNTYNTITCIHTWGNQTACLLVPDWLWTENIFFSSLPFIHNSVRFRIFNRSAAKSFALSVFSLSIYRV